MTQLEGFTAFFVAEHEHVGIYDIYDDQDEWVAQVRFPRKRGAHVYVLFQPSCRHREILESIGSRDAWRQWLVDHQGTL